MTGQRGRLTMMPEASARPAPLPPGTAHHDPAARPVQDESDEQLDDLVAFLKYSSEIKTHNWPPNKEG